MRATLDVPPQIAVAVAAAVAEGPVGEGVPAAAGPAVDAEAEVMPVVAVVPRVVADRHPGDVARAPVPVDPGGSEPPARVPDPAVGRRRHPAAVVVGDPGPGLVADPDQPEGRLGPPADLVGAPGGADVRPPGAAAVHPDPAAVARQRRGGVGEMIVDSGRLGEDGAIAVQLGAPQLQLVGSAGALDPDPRPPLALDPGHLTGADDARARLGGQLGEALAHHHLGPAVAVGADAVDPRRLQVDGGVGGIHPRPLVDRQQVLDQQLELAPDQAQLGLASVGFGREGQAVEHQLAAAGQAHDVEVRQRQLQPAAGGDLDEVPGQHRIVGLDLDGGAAGRLHQARGPFDGAQVAVARVGSGGRRRGEGRRQGQKRERRPGEGQFAGALAVHLCLPSTASGGIGSKHRAICRKARRRL